MLDSRMLESRVEALYDLSLVLLEVSSTLSDTRGKSYAYLGDSIEIFDVDHNKKHRLM